MKKICGTDGGMRACYGKQRYKFPRPNEQQERYYFKKDEKIENENKKDSICDYQITN